MDPIFPPPEFSKWNGRLSHLTDKIFDSNKFELIFDELLEGA